MSHEDHLIYELGWQFNHAMSATLSEPGKSSTYEKQHYFEEWLQQQIKDQKHHSSTCTDVLYLNDLSDGNNRIIGIAQSLYDQQFQGKRPCAVDFYQKDMAESLDNFIGDLRKIQRSCHERIQELNDKNRAAQLQTNSLKEDETRVHSEDNLFGKLSDEDIERRVLAMEMEERIARKSRKQAKKVHLIGEEFIREDEISPPKSNENPVENKKVGIRAVKGDYVKDTAITEQKPAEEKKQITQEQPKNELEEKLEKIEVKRSGEVIEITRMESSDLFNFKYLYATYNVKSGAVFIHDFDLEERDLLLIDKNNDGKVEIIRLGSSEHYERNKDLEAFEKADKKLAEYKRLLNFEQILADELKKPAPTLRKLLDEFL